MLVDVVMPQLGESVVEGTVVKWLVKPGDAVAKDQPLLEISTDKVDAEIPSPVGGVVAELLAKEGEVVPVKVPIARIDAGARPEAGAPPPPPAGRPQPPAAPAASPPPAPAPPPPAAAQPAKSGEWDEEKEGMPSWISRKGEAAGPIPPSPPVPPARPADGPAASPSHRVRITPVVARMAAEHGLDLSSIPGTGIDGRVTRKDVEAFLAGAVPIAAAGVPAPAPAPVAAPAPSASGPGEAPQDGDQVVPFSPIRKKIAEHMVRSKHTAPHVHAVAEVDLHRVLSIREGASRSGGKAPTVLPFVLAAAVRALAEFPTLNASVVGEALVVKKAVHLGVAVETDRGLMVPVVRDANRLSLRELAAAVDDLAARARERRITPDELAGGTFSVSNPGPRGNLFGTPIINQPQVGILRMGQVVKRPVVAEVEGADSIVIRPMMYLVLGYDHRVVDGVAGNGFLYRVREILEAGDFAL